ncbi:hypothetical protein IAU60_000329 [Kwoniella sp. DSM 27419]
MSPFVNWLFLGLLAGASTVSAQGSSSSDAFTIQTSPPTPTDSGSVSSASGPASGSSGRASATTSAASSGITPATFPQECAQSCLPIAQALAACGAGETLNTGCLCNSSVAGYFKTCLQCALDRTPTAQEQQVYQGAMDAYIEQCASATSSPVTLSNVTITLPSTSQTGSVSGVSGSNSMSSSVSLTSAAASQSTTSAPASSSASQSSVASSAITPAPSASAIPSGSNGASRRTGSGNGLMSVGLAGVVGAVIAAAAL